MRLIFGFIVALCLSQWQSSAQVVGTPGSEIRLDLDGAIATARDQSPSALLARHTFLVSYWEYRIFRSELLPSLSLISDLGNFNRTLSRVQSSETGAYRYVNDYYMNNDVYLSLKQNITLTGGTVSLATGLNRLDQFSPERLITYNSQPVYIALNQPLNGYNSFKWEKKIKPKEYELAKRVYLESMEEVTETVVGYYFELLQAQKQSEIARFSRDNTSQLYEMAKERFTVGTITRDALLQLELKLLNSEISISDCAVKEQMAMMKLRTYLGFNENVSIILDMPGENRDLLLSNEDVLTKVFLNSSTTLDNEIQTLSAEQEIAKARATNGLSAGLSLQFGLNQVGNDIPSAYRSPLDQEVVGISLTVPILDWGVHRGGVKVAKSKAEVVASQIEQSVNRINENIALKVLQFNKQGGQCMVSRRADAVGKERYASARERFLNGTLSVTDLNTAQSEMDDASLRYLTDLSNWWIYYYSIRRMTLFDYLGNKAVDADFEALSGER